MTKYNYTKTSPTQRTQMQQEYLNKLAIPLDGMWQTFIDMAEQYTISRDDEIIGHCVVNDEHKLLQFNLINQADSSQIFKNTLRELGVTGAFLSTAEYAFLALALDVQKTLSVNAKMYHMHSHAPQKATFPAGMSFRLIEKTELNTAVEFGVDSIGCDQNWLTGYYSDRISKKELFGLWQDKALIAAGERRFSPNNASIADVGMVVAKSHRGQGIATNILRALAALCQDEGKKAICSTEYDNLAAQKSIERAGFVSEYRILEFTF